MQEQLDITHRLNRLEDAARRLHATPDQVEDLDRRALELSRPSRGLRLWLPLKLYGAAAYRAVLEETIGRIVGD